MTVSAPAPTAITITGAESVAKGATITLTANVEGVTWAVDPAVEGASINSEGVLSITAECEAASVTVTATKEGCTAGSKTVSITD